MVVLVGVGVTLSTLVLQGVVSALVVEALGALVARRMVGTRLWRNGLATLTIALILWVGHLVQMAVWAVVFVAVGEFREFAVAFYHSAVNYTTLGYGDLIMSPRWRLLGPQEAASGTLAFGWSIAVIVTVVLRLARHRHRAAVKRPPDP